MNQTVPCEARGEGHPVIGSRVRTWVRRLLRTIGVAALILGAVLLIWLGGALYHRFVRFPEEEAAWHRLRAQRQPVLDETGWSEYRGILHSHSHLSHDSEVPFEEILRVLKVAGLDFICLSDHCQEGRADFGAQWRGLHDGKLFIPGFEMRQGVMPFGVRAGVMLSNSTDSATLARQVVENGGVFFYAHPEEPRDWSVSQLTGMEIYNIHTDFKQLSHPLRTLLPELLINHRRFPEQVFRRIFRRPVEILRHWDELNQTRHLTGIAGNDCHQNTGIRALYLEPGLIHFEDTSPKALGEIRLNWLTRPVARACFGPLQPGRLLWHVQLDPYERMARFVNTHILARELTEASVLDSLRAGRAFIGFDLIANSSGFRWWATSTAGTVVMGEKGVLQADIRLHAASPLPCRFTVVKDGSVSAQNEGRAIEWVPTQPGKYRVEAELNILGEWVPWVYSNPIELR
jgi:hypothetical protein